MFLACWGYLLMEWGSSPLRYGQSKSSLLHWEKENTGHQQHDRRNFTRRHMLMNLWFQQADVTSGSKCHEGQKECGNSRHFFLSQQPTYLVPHGTFFTSSVCSVVCETKTKVHVKHIATDAPERGNIHLTSLWKQDTALGVNPSTQHVDGFQIPEGGGLRLLPHI